MAFLFIVAMGSLLSSFVTVARRFPPSFIDMSTSFGSVNNSSIERPGMKASVPFYLDRTHKTAVDIINRQPHRANSQPVLPSIVRDTNAGVELFTIGAPGTANPPLENLMGNAGCFTGLRVWTQDSKGNSDIVTWANNGNTAGFWHAKMAAMVLVEQANNQAAPIAHHFEYPCSGELTRKPDLKFHTRLGLHFNSVYRSLATKAATDQMYLASSRIASMLPLRQLPPKFLTMTYIAAQFAYNFKMQEVAEESERFGFSLVDSAIFRGDGRNTADQISHLFQHHTTLECVITFKGTKNIQEGMTDAAGFYAEFCGFSNVHEGFRNQLRRMVQQGNFKTNFKTAIQQRLPSCAKVSAVGHSLGGAMSELFAACANRVPAPRAQEIGYDDYQFIGWTAGTPRRLRSFLEVQMLNLRLQPKNHTVAVAAAARIGAGLRRVSPRRKNMPMI